MELDRSECLVVLLQLPTEAPLILLVQAEEARLAEREDPEPRRLTGSRKRDDQRRNLDLVGEPCVRPRSARIESEGASPKVAAEVIEAAPTFTG